MSRRLSLAAFLSVLALPITGGAVAEQPLAVRAAVNDATAEGPIVRGTMRLTVVNGANYTVRGLTLRLVSPAAGAIGSGPIDVGDVEHDGTTVVTVQFRLEKTFMDSREPLTMEAVYKDADNATVKTLLEVSRDGGAL
jgi:hypothetical protein